MIVAYLVVVSRWTLALLLAAAGAAKVGRPQDVKASVLRYDVVPPRVAGPLARALPFMELGLALALAVGVFTPVAAGVAAVMLAAFAASVAWSLRQGKRFECGCGGVAGTQIGWRLVARNVSLVLVAAYVAANPSSELSLWANWPASHVAVASGSQLLPVPLGVSLVYLLLRCVQRTWRLRLYRQGASTPV